jgi:hypothetical protein
MTDKLRQAAEMALEALNSKYIVNCGAWMIQQDQAAKALRQALNQLPDVTKMIDKDFALNVALEALHNFADDESVDGWKAIDAIGVVRKALAVPPNSATDVVEPIGEIQTEQMERPFNAGKVVVHFYNEPPPVGTKLYATPPITDVEPVAWMSDSKTKGNGKQLHWTKAEAWRWSSNIKPLYTAPPNLPIEVMREMLEVQGMDGNWNYDSYMHGMYNGMECMLSLAEKREPQFRDAPDGWLVNIEIPYDIQREEE